MICFGNLCDVESTSKWSLNIIFYSFRYQQYSGGIILIAIFETASGAGSIHNTPGIAFQEDSAAAVMRQEDISVPKSKRRSIQLPRDNLSKRVAVNSKAEPPSFVQAQA